jgi:hypothetical protein
VLTVLFMPRIQERQRVAQGADMLQGWLLMAKQRALRDRIPTGIRLQPMSQTPADPTHFYVRDLQYIQRPDDYSQGWLVGWRENVATFTNDVDFLGASRDVIQTGDYLLVRGEGVPSVITAVPSANTLQVSPASEAYRPQSGTRVSYRIARQPRLLAGEQPLQLPQNVAVDLSRVPDPYKVPSRPPPASYWEILFSPSGRLVGQGTGNAPIALWVRDVTLDASAPGEQTLIVIYPLTGSIAAHPVAQGGDPFLYIRDGRSSGF